MIGSLWNDFQRCLRRDFYVILEKSILYMHRDWFYLNFRWKGILKFKMRVRAGGNVGGERGKGIDNLWWINLPGRYAMVIKTIGCFRCLIWHNFEMLVNYVNLKIEGSLLMFDSDSIFQKSILFSTINQFLALLFFSRFLINQWQKRQNRL